MSEANEQLSDSANRTPPSWQLYHAVMRSRHNLSPIGTKSYGYHVSLVTLKLTKASPTIKVPTSQRKVINANHSEVAIRTYRYCRNPVSGPP